MRCCVLLVLLVQLTQLAAVLACCGLLCIVSPHDKGSVLLSSLLESDRAVFAHLALAIELFALFPLWCRHFAAFHAVRLEAD